MDATITLSIVVTLELLQLVTHTLSDIRQFCVFPVVNSSNMHAFCDYEIERTVRTMQNTALRSMLSNAGRDSCVSHGQQEGQHPLTGQRVANFRPLANQ